jgi:hypothetical protein
VRAQRKKLRRRRALFSSRAAVSSSPTFHASLARGILGNRLQRTVYRQNH